jgi:hypothetical protein
MAYIGRDTDKISNVEVLDNITFDGSSSYTLQKGGSNFTPSSANTLLVSIDGVVQAGNFTVSGSTIDFGTAVAGTSTCDFILHYGVGLITAPSDGTVTEAKIGTNAVTPAKLGYDYNQYRNIIINGDMSIAQRGTSQASAGTGGGTYQVHDRFKLYNESQGAFTVSQSTDVPSGQGFAKSMKWDCTTADASPAAGDYLILQQNIEGQNLQYLKKGTSNAESITASFWVKSNKTGNVAFELNDADNTRHVGSLFTINSANTWEKKTITIAGDTSGAFDNDNANSLNFNIWLGAGSTWTSGTLPSTWSSRSNANRAAGTFNLADSTSNEFYITGVQLEAGTTASDFEFLPYDVNLQRCERYYQVYTGTSTSSAVSVGIAWNTTNTSNHILAFRNMMRTTPTLIQSSLDLRDPVSADYSATISISGGSSDSIQLGSSGSSGLVARRMYWIATNGGYLHFDGEL